MLCAAPEEVSFIHSTQSATRLDFYLYMDIGDKNVALQDVKKYKLGNPRTFHYLNQSNCYDVANVDDAREYLETRNAMDIVGIRQEEQVSAFI